MDTIRDWLKRRTTRPTSPPPTHTSQTDLGTRTNRAEHIRDLNATVSRLQQERLTLSNASTEKVGSASPGIDPRMAALERELDAAQRELGTIQGRI